MKTYDVYVEFVLKEANSNQPAGKVVKATVRFDDIPDDMLITDFQAVKGKCETEKGLLRPRVLRITESGTAEKQCGKDDQK